MSVEFLKETTNEWNCEFRVPLHIYILSAGKLIGYIKENTTEEIMFSKPYFFTKSRRTFKKLTITNGILQ